MPTHPQEQETHNRHDTLVCI